MKKRMMMTMTTTKLNKIEALIVRIVSNRYTVYLNGEMIVATAMGKLRLGDKPLVGDRVYVEEIDGKYVIQKLLPRRNHLTRPAIANVDQALIVMSIKEPDFSFVLVNRLIFLIAYSDIEPIIVVSKADLASDAFIEEIKNSYLGYKVIVMGQGYDTTPLEDVLEGKLSVLAGQSGVGKSSILNRINPDFKLNTQEISKALGRGKHTTRHNQLYDVAKGWIADTPGFSSLDFSSLDPFELSRTIPDFKSYFGECRYRDCLHINEPSCKIKEMVAVGEINEIRYENYKECLDMIKGEY